jgi:hypothetical protein
MIVGPVDGPRERRSKTLRVAAATALAIVLVVALATSRWRTSATPTIEPPPIASAPDDVVPASIDPAPEPESRSTVRPAPSPPPAVVAAPAPPAWPAPIPGKIQLVGEVRDSSGQRIVAMPAVLCYRTPTLSSTNSVVRGEFVVGGLDPGTMLGLECAVTGYRPESRRIRLQRGDGVQREDFVLQPLWMIDVELHTSDGKDVSRGENARFSGDFQFRVSDQPSPAIWDENTAEARRALRRVYREQTGVRGAGVFARIAPLCDPPAFLSVDLSGRVLASACLAPGVGRVNLVIPIESLQSLESSFRCTVVRGEDGSPLSGAQVTLSRKNWRGESSGVSDAMGRVRLGHLLCGSLMVILRAKDRCSVVRFSDFLPSTETDLGTIALDLSVTVRGRFVDMDGRPVEGRDTSQLAHEIQVLPLPADDRAGTEAWAMATQFNGKPDGTFEGGRFGRRRYLLRPSSRAVTVKGGDRVVIRPTVLDCTQGSVDDFLIATERAYPVTVRAEVDEANDFGLSIVDASGFTVERGDLVGARTRFFPSGDYRLLVGPDAAHMKEIPFTVESGPLLLPVEP